MNCDEATELLPWLVNGSLEETEHRQVREHLAACEACRQAMADTRLAGEIFGQHIPPEALVALAWGEATPGLDPALLESHLATCPECAAELELVRTSRRLEQDDGIALLTPRTRPATPGRWQVLTGWRAAALAAGLAGVVAFGGWFQAAQRADTLEAELAQRPATPRPAAPIPAAPGDTATESERVAALERQLQEMQETAAAMRERENEMRSQLDRLDQLAAGGPQINALVVDLAPLAAIVRGGEPGTVEIPSGAPATLLLQADPGGKTWPAYDVEVQDASGRTVWSARGLRRNEGTRDYTLLVPRGSLRPGAYTIQLYGRSGSDREPAERYEIEVR